MLIAKFLEPGIADVFADTPEELTAKLADYEGLYFRVTDTEPAPSTLAELLTCR